jgi:hypothetical protein
MRYEEDIQKLPERKRWLIHLLSLYAESKLTTMYENKTMRYTIRGVCPDRRRVPTVRKYLEDLNLIQPSYHSNEEIAMREEEIEKLLPGYTKEPEFNTSGVTPIKKYSYSEDKSEAISDPGIVYQRLRDLGAYETIYVYLHQDDYVFQKFTETYRNSRSVSGSEYNFVSIFPKKHIDILNDNILKAQNEEFAKTHPKEVLSKLLKIRFRNIKDDDFCLTLEDTSRCISETQKSLRFYSRLLKEYKILERHLTKTGDEAFKSSVIKTSRDYITRKAPLWIVGEDKEKKKLAQMFLSGEGELITSKTIYR